MSDSCLAEYTPGQFTIVTRITHYFRITNIFSGTISDYALFEVDANTKERIIIYMNDYEVYKKNLRLSEVHYSSTFFLLIQF